jgi:hypothetical protein
MSIIIYAEIKLASLIYVTTNFIVKHGSQLTERFSYRQVMLHICDSLVMYDPLCPSFLLTNHPFYNLKLESLGLVVFSE